MENMIIEYSEDNFSVIQEKEFAENIGHYRIIQFKSGQYALQVFEENWHTIIICPQDNDDGYLIVNNMLDFISRANDLYNKNSRDSVLKLFMHGLVMPYFHAQPCADATSDNGQQKQCGF